MLRLFDRECAWDFESRLVDGLEQLAARISSAKRVQDGIRLYLSFESGPGREYTVAGQNMFLKEIGVQEIGDLAGHSVTLYRGIDQYYVQPK